MKLLVCAVELARVEWELPEWLHLVPFGEWRGHRAVDVMTVGEADARAVVGNFAKRGIDLVIDWEHQTIGTMHNGQPAPAAGWIDRLEARADGVWGHVREWTPRAAEQLRAREYRYLSPVLELRSVDPKTGRPEGLWLSSVALTNVPFFAGDLKPVLNKGVSDMNLLATLIALLELPEDSSDQAVVDAVTALKGMEGEAPDLALAARAELGNVVVASLGWGDAVPADAKAQLEKVLAHEGYVAESELLTVRAELEQAKATQGADTVDRLTARALEAGKITKALETSFRRMAARSLAEATQWLDAAPVIVPAGTQVPATGKGKPPTRVATSRLTPAEQAACKALGLSEADYRKGLDG